MNLLDLLLRVFNSYVSAKFSLKTDIQQVYKKFKKTSLITSRFTNCYILQK